MAWSALGVAWMCWPLSIADQSGQCWGWCLLPVVNGGGYGTLSSASASEVGGCGLTGSRHRSAWSALGWCGCDGHHQSLIGVAKAGAGTCCLLSMVVGMRHCCQRQHQK